jgi:hypothetical protein
MKAEDVEKAKETLEGVVEKEMSIWKSLFTGAAVLEHMESKYHEVLKVQNVTTLAPRLSEYMAFIPHGLASSSASFFAAQ